jgi:prepilin-type N-terminal cleavage/methylation domain-containing protein
MVNNKSGFTLLEILVVIIIVGVLASVAMPTLFRNVERSRATEALNTLGVVRRAITGCGMQFNNNYTTCNSFNTIGMADPSGAAGSHFNYTIPAAGNGSYTVTATRTSLDNGVTTDSISILLNAGAITRTGVTAFAGIQ